MVLYYVDFSEKRKTLLEQFKINDFIVEVEKFIKKVIRNKEKIIDPTILIAKFRPISHVVRVFRTAPN